MSYQVPLGYVPISSTALRPLGAAYIPILLSEVEQEQRPSGNGDREAIVVEAGLCDNEGERAYTGYAPHIIRNVSANFFSLRRLGIYFCRNVRRDVFAETSFTETSGIRGDILLGKTNTCTMRPSRTVGVAVNRSNFSGRKDRGRTF